MSRVYLDHNATTRLAPEARRAMAPFLDEEFGNPSSIHAAGRAAREAVEQARDQVARLVGARREEIVLTSGGTEANQLAILGATGRGSVVTSPLEHPSVLGAVDALRLRGASVTFVPVDAAGRLDLGALPRASVGLVTLQLANHELGNLNPIARLAELAHAAGAWLHVDAVQAAGKLAVDVRALGADLLTLSAHKLHGPKGAGALFVREGIDPTPLVASGHQERGRRPGTENVAAIAGFGAAARLATETLVETSARVAGLRDRLEAGLVALGGRVNGDREARVGNTTNVGFDGADGELIVENLDLAGVCCSTGAACTSGSLEPSPVVLALGQSRAQAKTAVRFSLGRDNSAAEIDRVLALLPEILARVRATSSG